MSVLKQDGAELLGAFLKTNAIGREVAARALGVTRVTVWSWLSRESTPSDVLQDAIATWTSDEVPKSSWPSTDRRKSPPVVVPFEKPEEPAPSESQELPAAAAPAANGTEDP
jgi:transcriptional regulator with XRE-family HTH domain